MQDSLCDHSRYAVYLIMVTVNKPSMSVEPRTHRYSWWACKLIEQFGNLFGSNFQS